MLCTYIQCHLEQALCALMYEGSIEKIVSS